MLVPALLARTLYEILRRRIFKYPTASELRSSLLAAERADAVADALTIELDTHTSSGLGLRYDRTRKSHPHARLTPPQGCLASLANRGQG